MKAADEHAGQRVDGPEVRIRAGIEVKASTIATLLKTFAPAPGR
jgi:hypothetical protein